MNRRSLFKLLAGAACAAAIELTGLRPSLPRAAQYVVNPAYFTAEYEDVYLLTKESSFALRLKRGPSSSPMDDTLILPPQVTSAVGSRESLKGLPDNFFKVEDFRPRRYSFVNGQYRELPYYILKS